MQCTQTAEGLPPPSRAVKSSPRRLQAMTNAIPAAFLMHEQHNPATSSPWHGSGGFSSRGWLPQRALGAIPGPSSSGLCSRAAATMVARHASSWCSGALGASGCLPGQQLEPPVDSWRQVLATKLATTQ
jgi:hypothetical protein